MTTATALPPTFNEKFDAIMSDKSKEQIFSALPVVMFQDHVEVEVHQGVKKHISYASFKELINRSLNEVVANPIITGMSPPSNLIFMSQTENALHLNCYHSGGIKDMLYLNTKLKIVAPNIIIGFTLAKESNDWIVRSAHYFSTDLPVSKLPRAFINTPDPGKGIYDLPMSNTYGGGPMCYGSNSMPARFKDGNLRGLDWYYKYLWETPFNSDLGIRAISDRVAVNQWYEVLAKFAEEGKGFPYCDLQGYQKLDSSPTSESAIATIRNR
jgi:hypothetical protein